MKIRLIISAALVALLSVAVPATANAAVRTLAIEDPQGDAAALSGPVLDLKSVAVRYDDAAGKLSVVWTYYDDVRADESVMGSFSADTPVRSGVSTDMLNVRWAATGMRYPNPGSSWSAHAGLTLTGSSGSLPGTVTVTQDGRVVAAEFSHTTLAGHDWQYSWGGPVMYGDAFGDGTRKFWFDGYSDPNPPIQPPVGPVAPGPTPPGGGGATSGDQGMTINGGALYTNDPDVTLSVIAPNWARTMRVANDGGFRDATTVAVASTVRWRLAESGSERLPKTAYLRFGNDAQTFTDDIILDQTDPTVSSATLASSGSQATSSAVATAAASQARTYVVRLRAKDQTSGVAKLQFATNPRRPGALRRFERNSRYKGVSAPKYVRVRDRAGNFSRWRSIR